MFVDLDTLKIFVKPGPTDFRKQINGISIIASEQMKLDPFEKNIFLFSNKRRNLIKILYWDKNGFWLLLKRLEKDRFPWPSDKAEALEIDSNKLRMLLSGIDFWQAHKKLNYTKIN